MFVSIEEARGRILCPIYGALFHLHTAAEQVVDFEDLKDLIPGFAGENDRRAINGLTLSPCCRANLCGLWRWKNREDRDAVERRRVFFDGEYPERPKYLGAGTWSEEELERENQDEARFFREIDKLLEGWKPELEGWWFHRKGYDEEDGQIFAEFERVKKAEERFGYCGLAGRPEESQ